MTTTQPTPLVDTSVTITERTIITATVHSPAQGVRGAMGRLTDGLLDHLGETGRDIDPETVRFTMTPLDVSTTDLVVSVSAEVAL